MNPCKRLVTFAHIVQLVAEHHHIGISTDLILHDLTCDERGETSHLFQAMAMRAGMEIAYWTGERDALMDDMLPAILIWKGETRLLKRNDRAGKRFQLTDAQRNTTWVLWSDIPADDYEIILLKPKRSMAEKNRFLFLKKHWFWDSLKFSKGLYTNVLAATFLVNVFALLTPLYVRNIYNRVVPNAAFDTLFVLTSGIAIVYIFDALFRFLRTYLLELAGKKSDLIISSKIFEHILNMKLSHRFKSTGAFASNIKEFDALRNFLSSATLMVLVDLPFVILFLFVVYLLAGKIVLVPLLGGIAMIVYGVIVSKPLKKDIDAVSKLASWKNGILIESLSSLETIKSFGLHSTMQWQWDDAVSDIAQINMRSKMLTTSMSTVTNFLLQGANLLVIVLGVYAIHDKVLTMGGLIAVTMLSSRALTPLAQIPSLLISYQYAKSSYQILETVFSMPKEKEAHRPYTTQKELAGIVEFRDVSFAYPGSQHAVFEDLNFTIRAGEFVGILGGNGSGKTTLLKLIMGYYEPTKGSILIDGIDRRHLDPVIVREALNYLPQEVAIFNTTLRENLMYARPGADETSIRLSAGKSGLEHWVNAHPQGYDLPVDERGSAVSGGEKQLIALTRFFLREKASILLLDEPGNHLDYKAEEHAIKNLRTFTEGKTTLFVTHKHSFLPETARVLVLGEQTILYDGSMAGLVSFSRGKG